MNEKQPLVDHCRLTLEQLRSRLQSNGVDLANFTPPILSEQESKELYDAATALAARDSDTSLWRWFLFADYRRAITGKHYRQIVEKRHKQALLDYASASLLSRSCA